MYKIGDKVETPLGIGVVVGKRVAMRHDDIIFEVNIKNVKIDFRNTQVIAYKSAHEKLIEMGYEITKRTDYVFYRHDDLPRITIYSDKTYSCSDTNLALSRILTQYLDELNETPST